MKNRFFITILLLVSTLAEARLPDLIPYRKGQYYGYCDSTKKIIIACKFQEAGLFEYGDGDSARGKDGDWIPGYIMRNGDFHPDPPVENSGVFIYNWNFGPTITLWTPYGFDSCDYFYPVQNDSSGLYGYENCHRQMIIPCRYASVGSFSEGLAPVQFPDGRWAFIDKKGNAKIKFEQCEQLEPFSNGLATVTINGLQGKVNHRGEFVFPPVFPTLLDYGSIIASEDGSGNNFMLFNRSGKMIDSRIFQQFGAAGNGYWLFQFNEHWGYLDKNGKEIINPVYYEASGFTSGLAAVADSTEYYGFINEKGRVVIPFIYISAHPFSEGLALACDSSGNWGFINRAGKTVIPFKYQEPEEGMSGFSNGLFRFDAGYIDIHGTEYWEE